MWEIGLSHYLTVAAILFTLGIFGIFLNRKNIIIILMSIELMLLAVNINIKSRVFLIQIHRSHPLQGLTQVEQRQVNLRAVLRRMRKQHQNPRGCHQSAELPSALSAA